MSYCIYATYTTTLHLYLFIYKSWFDFLYLIYTAALQIYLLIDHALICCLFYRYNNNTYSLIYKSWFDLLYQFYLSDNSAYLFIDWSYVFAYILFIQRHYIFIHLFMPGFNLLYLFYLYSDNTSPLFQGGDHTSLMIHELISTLSHVRYYEV